MEDVHGQPEDDGPGGDDEWPPREARVRAALWQGEGHLLRGEWVHAGRTLAEAVPIAADPDLARGLRLLAAAGFRAREGDVPRARAQLERACARLAPFRPSSEDVDLEAVIASVAEAVESHA